MAQKVQVILVDDVDGGDAEETVSFTLDGVSYEIDLNAKNAAAMRDALAKWVGHARRVSGRAGGGRRARGGRSTAAGSSSTEMREWARQHGYTVSDRGRISAEVQQAYAAAH
jgi:Lsr2